MAPRTSQKRTRNHLCRLTLPGSKLETLIIKPSFVLSSHDRDFNRQCQGASTSSSSQEVTSGDSLEKLLNQKYPDVPPPCDPIPESYSSYKGNGERKQAMSGLGGAKSKATKASQAFKMDQVDQEENASSQKTARSTRKGLLSLACLKKKGSKTEDDEESDNDKDPAAFLQSSSDGGSLVNNSLDLDSDAFLGCSQDKAEKKVPKSAQKRKGKMSGLSIASLMGKGKQKTKADSPRSTSKVDKAGGFEDFIGFSPDDVEAASPRKQNMDKVVREAAKRSREETAKSKSRSRKLGFGLDRLKEEEEQEKLEEPEEKRCKSKASSAFSVEGMFESELDRFTSDAKSLGVTTKSYLVKQRNMVKNMRNPAAKSKPHERAKRAPKNQPSIRNYFSPPPAGSRSPTSNYLLGSDNEDDDDDNENNKIQEDLEILVTAGKEWLYSDGLFILFNFHLI